MASNPVYPAQMQALDGPDQFPESGNRLGEWVAYVLLFVLVCFPTMEKFLYVREGLVGLASVLIVIRGLNRWDLDRRVLLWSAFLASVTLTFVIRGLVLNAPGAIQQLQLYGVWPLIYTLLLGGVNRRILRGIDRVLVFSAIFIVVFVVLILLSQLRLIGGIHLEEWLFTPDELKNGLYAEIMWGQGTVETFVVSTGSLSFLVPYLMAAFACRRNGSDTWVSKKWLLFALLVGIPIVLLSGRRGLQLVTMLTPLFIAGIAVWLKKKERVLVFKSLGSVLGITAVLAVALLLLAPSNLLTYKGVINRFQEGFDFSASNTSDNSVGRVEQYWALTNGWKQHPFIGMGFGTPAPGSIRNIGAPWAYELSYSDLLFKIGLIGLAAYSAGVLWIFWIGIKIIKQGGAVAEFMVPALVGLAALLLANGTNPYIRSFDTLWPIFLPLAFINQWLLANQSNRRALHAGYVPQY